VQGEVYNPGAFVYSSGKTVDYYLNLSGDLNNYGDNSKIYIIKANGQIISSERKWFYNIRDERMERGDTILVPQQPRENDYFGLLKDVVDITYKTALAAGIFILRGR
jgi:protein involved in polysaccharide export with SLBB domain